MSTTRRGDNGCDFAVVHPRDSARATTVDDRRPGPVIRVSIHGMVTSRTIPLFGQFLLIERNRCGVVAFVLGTKFMDEHAERAVFDDKATTVVTKTHSPSLMQLRELKSTLALWTTNAHQFATRHDRFCGVIERPRKNVGPAIPTPEVAAVGDFDE